MVLQTIASESPTFDHGPVFTLIEENDLLVDNRYGSVYLKLLF